MFDPNHDVNWLQHAAWQTITRLLPRVQPLIPDPDAYATFTARLMEHLPPAFEHLYTLYGTRYDFFYHLEQILFTLAEFYALRDDELHALDAKREADPLWYKHQSVVGAVCYVDLFAGNFEGIRERISYFKELGITYLHLMPLFLAPLENSDGGYAISDYRRVNRSLGTMEQLYDLAADLRANGISLALDFVFNHTSDEHEWALQALAGDDHYQNFYYIFPDRTMPDQYAPYLREIFPEQKAGSFTYRSEIDSWVWTTFNSFQWDLNYGNPEVFTAMLGELLFIANIGTEIIRLDAVAFIWKQLGTSSENLPKVHNIIRAYNALLNIVAPAVLFKSEAIVHPRDVATYIDVQECELSYNPTFMALIWEALATREVKLLRHSMSRRYAIPNGTAWVNYVRVHDDIGWSFADEDAAEVGINGFDHRQFLNQFYTGAFPGSFAQGLPFNFNPVTRDMRICGMAASLAGLEQATDEATTQHAIQRLIMVHSLIIVAGGIPLLYLNDEIATLNDYSYQQDPAKANDNRWVHRPNFDWERAEQRTNRESVPGQVFMALKHMLAIRRGSELFADGQTLFFDTLNPHVLGMVRNYRMMVLANFSEHPQAVDLAAIGAYWQRPANLMDLYTGNRITETAIIKLNSYQFLWLAGG